MAIIFLLAAAFGANQRPEENRELTVALLVVSLLITAWCVGFALWRVRLVRTVFARGVVVNGWVSHVETHHTGEATPHDHIKYRYGGREYVLRAVNRRELGQEAFAVGEAVEVMVDPNKPARAFLVAHFFGKGASETTGPGRG
jgi:hypothetical protein